MLAFHGNGGTGAGTCNGLRQKNSWAAPTVATHILVCPDGISKSWNIVDEMSSADDVAFVHAILDYLAPFGNVDATATLMYGSSNGAALCNRILIESDDPRIIRAVMEVSQLNDKQYRNGNFYIGGLDNAYNTVKSTRLHPREVLSLQGAQDTLIPAAGGPALAGPSGSPFSMVSDADSIYAYAMAYGYDGTQLAPKHSSPDYDTLGNNGYTYWVYLAGGVESYTAFDEGHSVLSSSAPQYIVDAVQAFVARPPP
jgi:poly(3-hydroxybutyrate) depolymerase